MQICLFRAVSPFFASFFFSVLASSFWSFNSDPLDWNWRAGGRELGFYSVEGYTPPIRSPINSSDSDKHTSLIQLFKVELVWGTGLFALRVYLEG